MLWVYLIKCMFLHILYVYNLSQASFAAIAYPLHMERAQRGHKCSNLNVDYLLLLSSKWKLFSKQIESSENILRAHSSPGEAF